MNCLNLLIIGTSCILTTSAIGAESHAFFEWNYKGSVEVNDSFINLNTNKKGFIDAHFFFDPVDAILKSPVVLSVGVESQKKGTFKLEVAKDSSHHSTVDIDISCEEKLCNNVDFKIPLDKQLKHYLSDDGGIRIILSAVEGSGALVLNHFTLDYDQDNSSLLMQPDALIANNDSAITYASQAVSIPVLTNDEFDNSFSLYPISIVRPSNGQVYREDNLIVYTPYEHFTGTDFFTYTLKDDFGQSDTATVTVEVLGSTVENEDVVQGFIDNAVDDDGIIHNVMDSAVDDESIIHEVVDSVVVNEYITQFFLEDSLYWQLQGELDLYSLLDRNVTTYSIDLEDNENANLISALQSNGKKVICYFSAGSYEEWRSDADQFNSEDIGSALGSWVGEYWLDVNSANVRDIMLTRLDRAAAAGCDAVEPDNVDGYQNQNGLGLTKEDQLNFLTFLAAEAHSRQLSIGLKNSVELVTSTNSDGTPMYSIFDWALNEVCYDYNECDTLTPFITVSKPVFIAMYNDSNQNEQCIHANNKGFMLAFYGEDYSLDGSHYLTCEM